MGQGDGKYYALNVPLKIGCGNAAYGYLFPQIVDKVMETYRPDVIWMQCGADSLQGDLIGGFNMDLKGHGSNVTHMMKYNIPMVLVGGGGYTVQNVARAWAYETSLALNKEIPDRLPADLEYANEYRDEYVLHYKNVKHRNDEGNDRVYLDKVLMKVCENLKKIDSAPNISGVEVPTDYKIKDEEVWNEGTDAKIVDSFIFKEKGVKHLQEHKS